MPLLMSPLPSLDVREVQGKPALVLRSDISWALILSLAPRISLWGLVWEDRFGYCSAVCGMAGRSNSKNAWV